jgi:hypothetical protein
MVRTDPNQAAQYAPAAETRGTAPRVRWLRRLDWCLAQLEEAHLRGERTVSTEVAARVRRVLPAIEAGGPIVDALDVVFHEQARHLGGRARPAARGGHRPPASPPPVGPSPLDDELLVTTPLEPVAARALTERIRPGSRRVCLLLLIAHQRRAWQVLGYRSWAEYVVAELGISRSRSYELVEQGLVVRELCRAAGVAEMPEVSSLAAVQIKPYLARVAREVGARSAGVPPGRAGRIVADVVREMRTTLGLGRGGSRPADLRARRELRRSLRTLASMPEPAEVAARVRDSSTLPRGLVTSALGWMREFARRWEARERLSDAS